MDIPTRELILAHPKSIAQILKTYYPEFYQHIQQFPGKVSEKLYIYFNGQDNVCKVCGKPTRFDTFEKGYRKHCSTKCAKQDADVIARTKQTCLERYGVESPTQSKVVKDKTKSTNLKKYGGHPRRLKQTQDKQRQTCLERYGNATYRNTEQYKQTCLEKYGVENISQLDCVKERKIQTTRQHYGVDNPFQAGAVKDKIRRTCLKKYGVEYAAQIKTAERTRHMVGTNLIKYGVPYGFLNTEQGYSKASQEFFNTLKSEFPDAKYASNGGEQRFGIYSADWYDADSQSVIEYNGDYWHANPDYFDASWVHPVTKRTAMEIWKKDIQKYKYLKECGIDVYIVWDSDPTNIISANDYIEYLENTYDL